MLVGHGIRKLLRLFFNNTGTDSVEILGGTAAPGGDAGVQDAAPEGSIYLRKAGANSGVYVKRASTNAASDWEALGDVQFADLVWRNEKYAFATGDTVADGAATDLTALSDNEGGYSPVAGDVGKYFISDVDGTPVIKEITAFVSATSVTVATVAAPNDLKDNNTMVVQAYLPDSPSAQEGQAIIHFPSATGAGVKIGDVDWNFADGINMASAYSSSGVNGSISSADTVNSAIQKLEGNQDDIQTSLGTAQGDTSFGTFATGAALLLAASSTAKALFQRIGDLLAQLRGVEATGITAEADVDSVPVATVKACKWFIEAFEEATPANREGVEIYAINDGTLVVHNEISKLKLGSGNIVDFNVDIDTGNMRLRASSSTAGITVRARRVEVVKNVL